MISSQFQVVGSDLFASGLVSSHSGNISIRLGDKIIITRRGSRLACLEEHDLIETGIIKNDRNTPLATVELPVHRAIYNLTSAQAIIHAHPPHAVALSLAESEITPNCVEDSPIIGPVPVLGWNMEVKSGGLADIIAEALQNHGIVMVRGHGSFAIGQILEEAHARTTTLEESCKVLCLLKSLKVSPSEE